MKVQRDLDGKFQISRRSFLKGITAAGSSAALYGCSRNDGDTYNFGSGGSPGEDDGLEYQGAKFVYGTSAHNCGGRCIIRGQVVNGKIARFLTDENDFGYGGTVLNNTNIFKVGAIDMESPNCSQARACSRCRSYRFRLYHAGRLKYPLKQTSCRGDLNGFVRIS